MRPVITAARLCGVRVTEFFLGMPFKFKFSKSKEVWRTEVITPFFLVAIPASVADEALCLMSCFHKLLMSVQEAGSLEVGALAAKSNREDDRAYNLLYPCRLGLH